MPYRRNDRCRQCIFFERATGRGAPHPSTATDTGMRSDRPRLVGRTTGEQLHNFCCHRCGEIAILFRSPSSVLFPPRAPLANIRITFLFCLLEGSLFNQHTLALITATRSAETNHHGGKSAVFPGAPGEGGITSREIDQVIEIGAAQAKGAPVLHEEKISLPQFVQAFCAPRVAQDVEDHQFLGFW